ncbi:unnamed protein product, partial [Ixodes hexagonus]
MPRKPSCYLQWPQGCPQGPLGQFIAIYVPPFNKTSPQRRASVQTMRRLPA